MQLFNIISIKLSGGALTYTLFVAILSSIILSAMILGGYYYKLEYVHYKVEKQHLVNQTSATAMALAIDDLPYHETYFDQLFSQGDDSVAVTRQPWGIWDVFKVRSYNLKSDYTRYFTRGFRRSEKGESPDRQFRGDFCNWETGRF